MANINSIITYNANLSPAQAQIKALTGQVAGLTAAFNSLDASALKAQRSLAGTFAANVGQIGGFTAQTVKATSSVENFGRQLAANKLTMREYFREAITGYTRQNSLMRQLAEQQVRYQQSIAVPTGGGQTMMLTPQAISATSNAAQLASQRFSIFNQLVNGGATAMLNWGKNTQWAGRQLMVGFTLPLALFAGVMSKQFRELDMELTRFQKVYGSDLGNAVTESTQKMREQVQQLAYDISAAYGIAAKETAALAADIAATGREGEELMASVQQTTRLAVLGEVDRQEAMKATLSLQSAFRMNTDELAESINFLNAVENQTSATLQDLATAIPKVGPVIRSLGGDVKDLATLLVAMREGGIPAAEAANALKSGLASLINPTKQASAVAKQFGVDLVGIVEANQGQLMPTIYAMQNALAGLDSFSRSRIIEQIFGKYQFARISALFDNIGRTGSQTQAVIELATKSSAELAAVANGEIKTLTESTAVKFQRTLEQLKNSLMPIAQTLTETLIPVLQKVGEGIQMFSTFFSSLPESVKGLAKWGVALTALAGPVIMLVGLFGNLIANGIKFGMMIVRLGAKMAGIKTEKFQLLDEHVMAAKLGVDNLTNAFTTQEIAMKRLVGVLATYEQSLARVARTNPALFIPGAVPGARGSVPIRRQKGSTAPEKVPGGYGGGDRIPALLEPGESVITKEATAKFWPVIEAMNRGNLPGFNRGTIFLGMPRGYKDVQQAKQLKQTLSNTNIEATTGRFAALPVTDIGKKVTSIGGRSSSIPGVNGIYEEGGKKYVVKTHDTADSALAEVRGTQLTRDVFGLDTPVQELIKIKHPVTGDVIFAVRSPYDAKFAKSTGVIDEKNFFGQAIASIIRRDKDLQPDNLYGNIVTDVGQAFVANKASQPRTIGGAMPSVAEQTETNFLMSKGGARKWFAESTAAMAKKMPEDEYVKGFQTTIAEAARKARGAIDNLPYMTKEERMMYGRIIDDLDEAAKIDWRAVYQFHRGITPEVKRPPTAAAIAKKEAQEAEKARQRGDMARWEYGLPYRFQKGGKVPGGYGGGDKVPAYLEPGEFVITKEATRENKAFLQAINSGKKPGMYKTGRDSAGGSGQGDVGRAAKLHTVPPDELAKMYYGPGSKSMLGVLGYGGLTTTLHPQYINNTFDKLTGIPSWMKAGIPFNDRAAAQMLAALIKEKEMRGGRVGTEFDRSIQYLQKLIKNPGKARSVTLNGYAATTAAAERLAGIIPDTDKAQKARAQQLAIELNRRVGATTSPGRIFSTINRLSMEYIDKALADPSRRGLIWESTPGTSKTKFKDSLRERLPKFAQSGFLFRGIRLGRFQKGGIGTGEPALLEPGEFVVNSDASAKYAPILRAMNRGTISKYQEGRDDVSMRPGYNPNDPKYSSPDKTVTGGRHQGHIFGAPVAPGIPAFGKNLQIGGQAVFWHADFWKMITAAENQLANVLAMSAGNRARLMESLNIVGPQLNASQQQIDRIMLAATNGFMQHEDDVTLYQAALRNLGQRISTGAASVTGSMAGLIKQVESIKITGYSAAEAQAVERRLIAEYQRILSTPGKLAETARIAIAKQLQLVQQQMAATGVATTQMTSSLAASIQASAGRPFPGGSFVPAKGTTGSIQLAGAEQSLIKAMQLRERLQIRLIASSQRLEKLEAAEARVKADTTLSEQKRKVALDRISSQYSEELRNKEILEKASIRAEQNLIKAKERAAISYATVQPTTGGTPAWLRQRMDVSARTGPSTQIIPAMGVLPTGPKENMKDPMDRAMRGQGLMNVAFMGSMLVGSLGAMGAASEDVTSKLMMLSMALMALPMLQMMNPKGMATNFLGLKTLGGKMQAAGAARQAAGAAAAPAFGTKWVGNTAANVASGGPKLIPSGMTAGSGLLTAGRALSLLGGPPGIALALGITGVVTAYMLYKKAADEARERAIASFEDPAKSAEYFGETIDNLSQELEDRAGRFKVGEIVDIDPELRKIVAEEYAPLIERLKYSQAEDGARQLALAYNTMLVNGLSAENAQATLKAIATEAGTQGGAAYSEAFRNSMIDAETIPEAIQKQLDFLNPEKNKDLIEKIQAQIPSLESAALNAAEEDALSRWELLGKGLGQSLLGFDFDRQKSNWFDLFGQIEVGMTGLGNVWTAVTGQIFDSTPEARAADAAANAVDQAKTSIEELKQLSADAFAASTEDFMKAYEDAPQQVIEAIRMSSQWLDASSENVDILKQKLMELSPVLAGLIATLENPEQIALFYQLLTVGADPTRFFDENGFNTAAATRTVDTIAYYDELENKNNEMFDQLKEDTIDFIDEEIKAVNKGIRKINQYWDNLSKLARKEQRQAQKDYDQAQKRSEKFIDAKQDEIEAIQDAIDSRRDEFDERMQGLQDEKDMIEESTDKYIDSLNKRKEADSFYAQQRKTSISALQKLAAGDVFGFLQDREQMSSDAQTFSYDQMISDIEDRRDLEVDAIDETMEKERRRQEEWEKAQRDKIDGINDLIDAERDLMDERTKAHEKDLRQFEKRQKEYERGRKQELRDERTKLADLTKAREKAEALELADYEEMTGLLGEEYKKRFAEKIIGYQKEQYYIRLNYLIEKNLNQTDESKRLTDDQLKVMAFTQAFGSRPQSKVSIDQQLSNMGMFPYGPGQGGQPLASGGKVIGPGGPKSDVIPALLSNGEYVVQASSVKKYGTDLMNTINAGKFATGGYVVNRTADREEQDATGTRGMPRPKPTTTYNYTPGAKNPVTPYNYPKIITGYPPNLTSYFDTNRRYQDKNIPDNNYRAKGKYSGKSYVPYAQDALDARTLPDGYSGGKKWRENMSRLNNLGLNSAEFFNQWRNLRRWEKEQFIRSLDNVSINQPPPTIIRDSRDTSRPIRPPGGYRSEETYNNNWWTNYESKAKAYVRALPGGADRWMIQHFNDTDGHHAYRIIPRGPDNRPWWQKMFIPAYDDGAGHLKGIYDDDGTRWPDKGDKGTAVDYGWANGGIVGFKNGSSNPTWYSADRSEQAATGTRGQSTKPYRGTTATTYKPTGTPMRPASNYTYTPNWIPGTYNLPAQRYGPYGVGRIPGTRKPYNKPEFGRTADLSATLASNYSHKLGAYASIYQHLEYFRQKAGGSPYVPGYGYVNSSGGGNKWQSITNLLSSPFGAGARDRLTGSARDIPTLDYWRTLSREQKAWFLEYATTGNTNNWSNSRVFKLMPWLPKETKPSNIPTSRLNASQDRIKSHFPYLPMPMRGPGTSPMPLKQHDQAPTSTWVPNWNESGIVAPTDPYGGWIPVVGDTAQPGYPDTGPRGTYGRKDWGWPWDGSGTKDNAQSPIRFRPGMTPDTTRTSLQERYPIGMSGIYLGTSTWMERTLDKLSSGQALSLVEKSSLNNLYERLSPTEKRLLVSEVYKRSMPSRESISLRSLNEMSSIQRGATLRTINNETGYEFDLIRRRNGGMVQKFAGGGLAGPNGWPYSTAAGGPGFPMASATIPGTSVSITMNKDVLPLFLAFASDYNKMIKPIKGSMTGGYDVRGAPEETFSNHPSGTALDINWNEEGSHYSYMLGNDPARTKANFEWWKGNKSTLAPWDSLSPVPYQTMRSLIDKYKVLQWFGPSSLGGPNWLSWSSTDPMHVQLNQDTDPTLNDVISVMNSLGIKPDGTGASGTAETPGAPTAENKTKRQEKAPPRMGLSSILKKVGSVEAEEGDTPTSTDTTTTTNTEAGSGGGWLRSFIASKGVSGEVAKTLWAIAMKESGGDPGKLYPQKSSYDWNSSGFPRFDTGLFQINNIHLDKVKNAFGRNATMQDMLDPEKNWTIMEQLSSNFTKWNPWGIATDMVSPDWTGWPATTWSKEESFNRYMSYRNQFADGGIVKMFAAGGKVRGPGGPRSDMIPAMLSNGEYVVKASSVAKYGKGFMDKVNAGQLNFGGGGMAAKYANGGMVNPARFADGGFVGSMDSAPMPTFGMPQMTSVSPTDISSSINNVGGSSNSSSSNTSNVKVIINGAGGKSAKAIANRVISIINEANGRRNHSRSI